MPGERLKRGTPSVRGGIYNEGKFGCGQIMDMAEKMDKC